MVRPVTGEWLCVFGVDQQRVKAVRSLPPKLLEISAPSPIPPGAGAEIVQATARLVERL
jgi:hypothetical protein